MKILYVCRLYSGFEESLKAGTWNPKGAPTIARMIEHLDKSAEHDLTIILTQKGTGSNFTRQVKVEGLSKPITIIAGLDMFPSWTWKFREKLSDIHQLIKIIATYHKIKPDIVYCDRINIVPAAFLSRFTKAKVIWRVMGVLHNMHDDATQKTPRAKFRKWLWRSPFKAVICTMDGSNGRPWLETVINKNVSCFMLLNGIEKKQKAELVKNLPEGKIKILFAGRLEEMKGVFEFIEAFSVLAQTGKYHAIIAGDGSLLNNMKQQSIDNNIKKHISFLGSVTQLQLKYVRQNCDIYVSLNTHGNLTNVNLEALSDALPTIIPSSNQYTNIDSDTDRLIPSDVFYRFGKVGDKDALVDAIKYMANNENRVKFKNNMKACADKLLPSWQERIDQELQIFSDVQKAYDLAIVIADLGSGGAQKVATSLASDCANNSKVGFITLSDDKNDFFKLPDNVKRIALNSQKDSNNIFGSIIANTQRIRALRCTLKYISPNKTVSFITPTNILTIIAGLGLNTKIIISERNDPARQSFGRFWDGLRVKLYRFADMVTANSPNAVESLKEYVPEEKLVFIPNALPKPDTKYIVPYASKEKIVLIVGRLHPQKAHKTLLDAFSIITKDHSDWSLIIAGDGPLKEDLKSQATELGLSDKITFTGVINDPHELYARASIFVLPSIHEGTPNALLEAMSCGVAPIISDACEGALPYVVNDESGLIFPVGDVTALANALDKMISDQAFCQKIGASALKKVASLYEKITLDMWSDVLFEGECK